MIFVRELKKVASTNLKGCFVKVAILTDGLSLPPQTQVVLVLRALFNRSFGWL
jgi:hypothetical protein